MKISEILDNGRINLSLEVFPPKKWENIEATEQAVSEMAKLSPSFVSVTYGAGGGTSAYTTRIANHIRNGCGLTALSHMTCVGTDREKALSLMRELAADGVENILALRGDIPESGEYKKDFKYACDLASFIKQNGDFCVGGACYPEGHPDAPSIAKDIDALKIKAESGVDFFTTQMFFDNNIFYCFLNKLYQRGIKTPVITGIMPITNASQLKRIISLSGSIIPTRFLAIVEKFGEDPASMRQAGILYACEQIVDLVANGVRNVHIYTMNKPEVASAIVHNLSEIVK
ncbi:MAG: methylenetetrahydrofolate reductase [Clostridia bacterium]|nr:methylenetetrahydrofolate reductase [NAD(P)H] [Clostridia bacterium]